MIVPDINFPLYAADCDGRCFPDCVVGNAVG